MSRPSWIVRIAAASTRRSSMLCSASVAPALKEIMLQTYNRAAGSLTAMGDMSACSEDRARLCSGTAEYFLICVPDGHDFFGNVSGADIVWFTGNDGEQAVCIHP